MDGWPRQVFHNISRRCSIGCMQATFVVAFLALLVTQAHSTFVHHQPAAAERKLAMAGPSAGVEIRPLHQTEEGRWTIRRGATMSTAIEQSATEKVESRFPAGIGSTPVAKDFDASVRFKMIGGRDEQAGIALRLTTPQDYDIVQVDAHRGTVSFSRVTNGMTAEIVTVEADVLGRDWQTLRIRAEGEQFTIWLAGAWLFTAYDHSIPSSGHITPWTAPESQARFEGFEVTPFPAQEDRRHSCSGPACPAGSTSQ